VASKKIKLFRYVIKTVNRGLQIIYDRMTALGVEGAHFYGESNI